MTRVVTLIKPSNGYAVGSLVEVVTEYPNGDLAVRPVNPFVVYGKPYKAEGFYVHEGEYV